MTDILEIATPRPRAGADPVRPEDRPAARSVLRKNIAFLGMGQLFTWSMTLAWTLIVPRILGPYGMGFIATGMSVAGILQVVLGAGTGVYVAREAVLRPERAARLVASAAIARMLLVPVFALAVFAWAQVAGYSSQENLVLYLCGGATVLMLLSEPLISYFQATERMQYLAIGDAINKASQGLGGIALALAGVGAVGFGWCWVVTAAAVLVLGVRWLRRFERVRFTTTLADLKEVARGSAVYWATGLFFTVYLWIDTAMLSLMTNPTVVGWYGVPTRLFGTMLVVPTMFSRAWLPQLVRANQRSRNDLWHAARAPIELVFVLALPIASLIAAVASPGIHLVYGSRYDHSIPVLIILGVALIPMYLNIMLNQVCVAAGRQGMWTWLMVGATIVNPALNAALIPLTQRHFGNGAVGAAIALAVTELAIAIAGFAIVGRQVIGVSMVTRTARMLAACGCMWAIIYATRGAGAYVALGCGCVALLLSAVVFGAITRTEQRAVIATAAKLAGRITRTSRQTAPDPRPRDSGPRDVGPPDVGPRYVGPPDVGPPDVGPRHVGPPDVGPRDARPDGRAPAPRSRPDRPVFVNGHQPTNGSLRSSGGNASLARIGSGVRTTAVSLLFAVVLIRVMTPARRAALLRLLLSAPRRVRALPRLARTRGRRRIQAGAPGSQEARAPGITVVVRPTKPQQLPLDEKDLGKFYASKREGTNWWNVDV